MNNNYTDNNLSEHSFINDHYGFYSSRVPNTIWGIIFLLFSILGFVNCTFLSSFILFIFSYCFGVLAYFALILIAALGIYLIIFGKWPQLKLSFVDLGLLFVFLFGCLVTSANRENLNLANFSELFQTDLATISTSSLKIDSILQLGNIGGGFLGYLLASMFLTGLGQIGTYIFTCIFLFVGILLCLYHPLYALFIFIHKKSALRKAQKKQEEIEKKKEEEAKANLETENVVTSPFKESPIDQTIQSPLNKNYNQDNKKSNDTVFSGFLKPKVNDNQEDDLVRKDEESKSQPRSTFVKEVNIYNNYNSAPEKEKPFDESNGVVVDATSKEHVEEAKASPFSSKIEKPKTESFVSKESNPVVSEKKEEPQVKENPNSFNKYVPNEEANVKFPTQGAIRPTNDVKFENENPFVPPTSLQPTFDMKHYTLPSIELLKKVDDYGKLERNQQAADSKIEIINGVFSKLGIGASVQDYTVGPSVTRFNIAREDGVKVSEITNNDVLSELQIDLSGDMSVRVEGVSQGENTCGVEVGNIAPMMVSFRDCYAAVLEQKEKLTIPLGKSISNKIITISLDDMPHLLISGTTGSGKSVFVHSLIMTLIMRNYPDELKFILVDPKQVEFTRYRNMPHLYCPIVTNVVQAVAMLKKLVQEMERRYTILSVNDCQKIQEYYKLRKDKPGLENLPYIVVVIDEFADMMGQDPKNVDSYTQRLAQKARACGIYLIIATQRPSKDCITGTIKANIPARVALYLPTYVDSRTILDEGGAETLLGKGDLLARIPVLKGMTRLQSAFVSNEEISSVVKYLASQCQPQFNKEFINFNDGEEITGRLENSNHSSSGFEDDLYEQVKSCVIENNIASTSYLQRKFGIGYSRAASILDALEEEGIIRTIRPGNRKEVVSHTEE